METIEQYRDPCVRGDKAVTRTVVDDCERAFVSVHKIFKSAED